MSDLKFQNHCGNCLIALSHTTGYVLSCGDFICDACKLDISDACPACGLKNIKSASLTIPPAEVKELMEDPSTFMETLYESLKFQIQHYKEVLKSASSKLRQARQRISDLEKREVDLSSQLKECRQIMSEQGTVLARSTLRDSSPSITTWKSGSLTNAGTATASNNYSSFEKENRKSTSDGYACTTPNFAGNQDLESYEDRDSLRNHSHSGDRHEDQRQLKRQSLGPLPSPQSGPYGGADERSGVTSQLTPTYQRGSRGIIATPTRMRSPHNIYYNSTSARGPMGNANGALSGGYGNGGQRASPDGYLNQQLPRGVGSGGLIRAAHLGGVSNAIPGQRGTQLPLSPTSSIRSFASATRGSSPPLATLRGSASADPLQRRQGSGGAGGGGMRWV